MSLLLEALKKAEKAKEEAQRRAGETASSAPAAPAPGADLQLQREEPAAAASERHVMTKSELPSISQPLEILSDDLSPRAPASAPSEPRPAAPSAGARTSSAPRGGAEASVQRAAARKVFEAKFKESNPRLPFFIA